MPPRLFSFLSIVCPFAVGLLWIATFLGLLTGFTMIDHLPGRLGLTARLATLIGLICCYGCVMYPPKPGFLYRVATGCKKALMWLLQGLSLFAIAALVGGLLSHYSYLMPLWFVHSLDWVFAAVMLLCGLALICDVLRYLNRRRYPVIETIDVREDVSLDDIIAKLHEIGVTDDQMIVTREPTAMVADIPAVTDRITSDEIVAFFDGDVPPEVWTFLGSFENDVLSVATIRACLPLAKLMRRHVTHPVVTVAPPLLTLPAYWSALDAQRHGLLRSYEGSNEYNIAPTVRGVDMAEPGADRTVTDEFRIKPDTLHPVAKTAPVCTLTQEQQMTLKTVIDRCAEVSEASEMVLQGKIKTLPAQSFGRLVGVLDALRNTHLLHGGHFTRAALKEYATHRDLMAGKSDAPTSMAAE